MKKQLVLILCIALIVVKIEVVSQNLHPYKLLPMPQHVEWYDNMLTLDSNYSVLIVNYQNSRVVDAVDRFNVRLAYLNNFKSSIIFGSNADNNLHALIKISYEREGDLKVGENEAYEIQINENGIFINAETDLGVLHALETLYQIISDSPQPTIIPTGKIIDTPRFVWRGLMLDVCRHFIPFEIVKRNIDAMAMVKLNVLHLHLSENQGFRIESKTFPLLHQLGSNGDFYTQEQIKELIEYADLRGIRVVPEFDIPGHSTSWFVGYPQYASAPGPYELEKNFGVMNPVFNPAKPETYVFFEKFLNEMCQLFPDEYFHIGGDENDGVHWNLNPEISKFKESQGLNNNHDLQAFFNKRIEAILIANGKKMIGWDEILNKELPKSCVIHSWRGQEAMITAAKTGYASILSSGYYIDLCQPIAYHYLNNPLSDTTTLNEQQKQLILGGEATMWSELVDKTNVESRIWPRTAAIAERLWSQIDTPDFISLYTRLDKINILLEDCGLQHIAFQGKLLRSAIGKREVFSVLTFLQTIAPVQGYKRHQFTKYTTSTPLNRLVDIAVPDPLQSALWREKISLEDKERSYLSEVKDQLALWKNSCLESKKLFYSAPRFLEAVKLTDNVNNLCLIGLEAIAHIEKNETMNTIWLNNKLSEIKNLSETVAECEPTISSGIINLVKKAAQ